MYLTTKSGFLGMRLLMFQSVSALPDDRLNIRNPAANGRPPAATTLYGERLECNGEVSAENTRDSPIHVKIAFPLRKCVVQEQVVYKQSSTVGAGSNDLYFL